MGWFRELGRDKPWAQGCVIAGAGLVLAVGSCFGLLFTMSFNTGASTIGNALSMLVGIFMFLCALAVLVGIVWFVVGLVKNATKQSAPPPPAPPAA
jgi:hypothetical protein